MDCKPAPKVLRVWMLSLGAFSNRGLKGLKRYSRFMKAWALSTKPFNRGK